MCGVSSVILEYDSWLLSLCRQPKVSVLDERGTTLNNHISLQNHLVILTCLQTATHKSPVICLQAVVMRWAWDIVLTVIMTIRLEWKLIRVPAFTCDRFPRISSVSSVFFPQNKYNMDFLNSCDMRHKDRSVRDNLWVPSWSLCVSACMVMPLQHRKCNEMPLLWRFPLCSWRWRGTQTESPWREEAAPWSQASHTVTQPSYRGTSVVKCTQTWVKVRNMLFGNSESHPQQ